MTPMTFACLNNQRLTVEDDTILNCSEFLRPFINQPHRNKGGMVIVELTSTIMEKIVEYSIKHHGELPQQYFADGTPIYELAAWDYKFLKINRNVFVELAQAAGYLKIKNLTKVCTAWLRVYLDRAIAQDEIDLDEELVKHEEDDDKTRRDNETGTESLGEGQPSPSNSESSIDYWDFYKQLLAEMEAKKDEAVKSLLQVKDELRELKKHMEETSLTMAALQLEVSKKHGIDKPPFHFHPCLTCGSLLSSLELLEAHKQQSHLNNDEN